MSNRPGDESLEPTASPRLVDVDLYSVPIVPSPAPEAMQEAKSATSHTTSQAKTTTLIDSQIIGVPKHGRKYLIWAGVTAAVPTASKAGFFRRFKKNSELKTIIHSNGYARPGEVLALMGGSGAGKTTLLNILSHHSQKDVQVDGSVLVNGEAVSDQEMRALSAYVQQIDMFCGTLTVREQLNFSAALRMSRGASKDERREAVERAIRDMNLTNAENTVIGLPGRVKGISVGEKKRLAFACEALTDPAILFCDEPTSGLDSFMAAQVVNALEVMAKQGKTIICVIHQPSTQTFLMFHKVCFMAMGRVAYFGPVAELCNFFGSMGRRDLAVPESYNPADHAIAKLSITDDNPEENEIIAHFEKSDQHKVLMRRCQGQTSSRQLQPDEEKSSQKYAARFHKQVWVIFKRSFLTTLREPLLLQVRFAQIVLTALAVGIVNWRTPVTGPTVMNLEGVIYNTARDMTFLFLFPSINVITSELPLVLREHQAHIYSIEAYYVAKSLAELPQYTALPAIYCLGVYFMTGLDIEAPKVFIFLVVCILLTWNAVSVAYAAACSAGDEGLAVTFTPLFVLPMLLFGGFYINFHNIPSYFRYFSYLSWFRYGFETLEINQWADMDIEGCTGHLLNGTNEGFCPAEDGDGLLVARGINRKLMVVDIMALLFMQFIFRAIGLLALWLRGRFAK